MNNNPLVSICVPIYGIEKYIERCAISLFEQTYSDIEYLFVNDCTKDNSIELLESVIDKYPNRNVRILKHENNRGLAAARNTAVDASTGDYIMHVDGDDFIESIAVEKLVENAENNCSDIVIFGHKTLRKNNEIVNHPVFDPTRKEDYIKGLLLHATPASIWNKFYNAKFYRDSGIRSIEGLNFGEDYAVVPRLLYVAQRITVIDAPLYNYEQSNITSYTNRISEKSIRNLKSADDLLLKYFNEIREKDYFRDIIPLIPIRSMLSLVKMAGSESYQMILDIYNPSMVTSIKYNLGVFDRVLFYLFTRKQYKIVSFLVSLFWRIIRR